MVERRIDQKPSLKDLLPGGYSRVGFLERGQTLEEVTSRDLKAIELMGYTLEEISYLVGHAFGPGRSRMYKAPNGKLYHQLVKQWRGFQQCPWLDFDPTSELPKFPGFVRGSSIDILVKTQDTNEHLFSAPGMLPHLVREHSFFEGGLRRVSPEKIVELFGVEKVPGSIEEAKRLPLKP